MSKHIVAWLLARVPVIPHGREVTIYLRPGPDDIMIFHEVFAENVYCFDTIPFEPSHIIDCGAHIGLFTLVAHEAFPNAALTAFEPNPSNYAQLTRNLESNKANAKLIPAAVSDRRGEVTFVLYANCAGRIRTARDVGEKTLQVSTVDLREYIRRVNPKSLVLKLDIEGHEEVVMPHVIDQLPPRTAIFLECHSGEEGWSQMKLLLERNGFASECIRSRGIYVDARAIR